MVSTACLPWAAIESAYGRLRECWSPMRVVAPVFSVQADMQLPAETDRFIQRATGLDSRADDGIERHALHLVRRAIACGRAASHGFANPFVLSPAPQGAIPHGCHFFALLFGCQFRYTDANRNSFSTWPLPILGSAQEVSRFQGPTLDASPVVDAYLGGVTSIRRLFDARLPFEPPCFSLTDTAAALWSATDLMRALVEEPGLAGHLLDVITRTFVEFHRRFAEAAGTTFGRVYSNDLLNEFVRHYKE